MSSIIHLPERVSLRARQLQKMTELFYNNLTSQLPAAGGRGPVVSLTTFGKRARTVGFTIESIALGSVLPSRLLLWLDEPGLLDFRPAMLRRLERRGVEVRPTRNFGPHKKYFPYVCEQTEFPQPLVTADDDVLYPKTWLEELAARYASMPTTVHCYRARVAEVAGSRLTPYATWRECSSTHASHRHFSIGMAGVLWPEPVLRELKRRGNAFQAECGRTDDIWLNLQAQRVGCPVRQVHAVPHYPMLLPGTQKVGLLHVNVEDGNDVALRSVYEPADLERVSAAP